MEEAIEEQAINEEYKVWKKKTPLLYDMLYACALHSPSLTVQFRPHVSEVPANQNSHMLLLGTQSTNGNGRNCLIQAALTLPLAEEEKEPELPEGEKHKEGGKVTMPVLDTNYQCVLHDGEVYRARYMPQNPALVASRGPKPSLAVYNFETQPMSPPPDTPPSADIYLTGHKKEGYGIAWNPIREGLLASGGVDGLVCVWDVGAGDKKMQLQPLFKTGAPPHMVDDIAWSHTQSNTLAAVKETGTLDIYDIRASKTQQTVTVHEREATCVAFSPLVENLLATCSVDKSVLLWDTRHMKRSMHSCHAHTDEVYQLHWSPHHSAILGSSGADRRVLVWDLTRIGQSQTANEAAEGPPELLFIHGGHTSKMCDFSWSPTLPWTVASVADNNLLQVWQMAEDIYSQQPPAPPHQISAEAPNGTTPMEQ